MNAAAGPPQGGEGPLGGQRTTRSGERGGNFWRHWRRLTLLPLLGLLLTLAAALAGLWVWTGAEGSLAATLHWAGRWTALTAQGVRGNIRHGGTAEQLTWTEGGLRVQVRGARITWSPAALLHERLHVRELAAAQIVIEDRRAPEPEPSTGPPHSLALPLAVQVDAFAVSELRWAGPPDITLREAAGSYQYDSGEHRLQISQARIETEHGSADLSGRITQQAAAPLTLDAALSGTLQSQAAPVLAVQAALHGPLADLQATLDARTAGTNTSAQQAQIQARLTLWAAQPLPEAHARVQRLDLQTLLAPFWPQAPRTAITGQADLAPIGAGGWRASADLSNAERSLPIERAQASVEWQGQTLTVRTLTASGAGSQLTASGQWRFDARQGAIDAALTAPGAALALKGELAPERGAGHAQADVADAARLLAWVRALGLDQALATKGLPDQVHGQAHLMADWRGGWRNPQTAAVRAELRVPELTVRAAAGPPQGGERPTPKQSAGHAGAWGQRTTRSGERGGLDLIHVQDLHARLNGTLAQAHLTLAGRAHQGQRHGALHLAASGGQVSGATPLAWQVSLNSLGVQAQDPQLGGWTLDTAAPVTLTFKQSGAFDLGAGAVTLRQDAAVPVIPAKAGTQSGEHIAAGQRHSHSGEQQTAHSGKREGDITFSWDASHWDGQRLATSGRLHGLSLAWLERLAGQHLRRDAGISGDVALAGAWRAHVGPGQPLDLHASLERTAGDLTLVANDPQTGLQTHVAAGLQVARVTLDGSGHALRAQVQWASERAGHISADLRTQLMASPGGLGWAWPEDAPLAGQISARLPQLAVWSALAPPGWRLRGALAADAHVAGTRGDPHITGTLTADGLMLRSVVDGVQLDGGQLRARFDGARLVIDDFSLHGTGGTLTATGAAGWADGRAQAHLTATLDHLRAGIRPERQVTVSGRVQAALDGRLVTARGQLEVNHADITLPDQSAPALDDDVVVHGGENRVSHGPTPAPTPSAQEEQLAAAGPPQGGERPLGGQRTTRSGERGGAMLQANVEVHIDLGEQFRVRGQGIDTRLTGALTLAAQGPLNAMPRLTGIINTAGGRFQAYGQTLDIAHGALRFSGAADNPALDILALRPIYDANQKAGVQIQGTALLPHVRLYADPALPDNQTLAWLLLGHAAPATGAESAMLQAAALALLGGREGKGLAAHFGLDALSLNNTTDASGAQNTSVTLGKRLSRRLYAAYQQSLSGAAGSLLIFYELSRRWQLRAQTGQNSGVDLIFSLRFD